MKNWLFLFFIFCQSCAQNLGSAGDEQFKVVDFANEVISFDLVQENVLIPKCLKCHGWIGDETEILKRIVVGSPEESPLFLLIDNGAMPLGGPELTEQEKRLVYDYIVELGSQ